MAKAIPTQHSTHSLQALQTCGLLIRACKPSSTTGTLSASLLNFFVLLIILICCFADRNNPVKTDKIENDFYVFINFSFCWA
jgi:hypothetical protein